ncbi:MAG: MBL fold metallo-hydrolase [Candidatus Nitrosopolaris sp.]|jgi:phosphoribosyl 1,2-cyclic phosphodiesterase
MQRTLTTPEKTTQLLVRINGTLPNISTMDDEQKSERAAEIKRKEIIANTSCSIFSTSPPAADSSGANTNFHLLVDVGEGVVESLEKSGTDVTSAQSKIIISDIPNAVLITHSHDDQIKDLPKLFNKVVDGSDKVSVYCTKECFDQIMSKFPQLAERRSAFNIIEPNKPFTTGPFTVIPVVANHGDNSTPNSVIYVVKYQDKKIIMGWDFLSLPNADENLLWNPDLLVLGTHTYNPHPESGMISVIEAYELVRRWNAKESYLVQYSGLLDFKESKNEWFKGPSKAMTTVELQRNIDSHLKVSGDNGRFRITVANEGMLWAAKEDLHLHEEENNKDPIGRVIEVEGLQKYTFKIEKDSKVDKLRVIIEDRINRYSMQFDRPHIDKGNEFIIRGEGEQGTFSKGPALRMELVHSESKGTPSALKILADKGNILKGKKDVFHDDILVSDFDANRLKKYFQENFVARSK